MPTFTATLHLTDRPVRELMRIDAETRDDAAALFVRRYPFMPPECVQIDGTALSALGTTPRTARRHGQTVWQERVRRQRAAERWRQHWIDKDNAKRATK